jgi:hypothetical protein
MMADPVALVHLIENDQEIRNIRFYSESVSEDGCEIETKMRGAQRSGYSRCYKRDLLRVNQVLKPSTDHSQ